LEAWRIARFLEQRKVTRCWFTQAIQQNPTLTTRQIRRLPGNSYMWLYRNDREWLREHLPAIWRASSLNRE